MWVNIVYKGYNNVHITVMTLSLMVVAEEGVGQPCSAGTEGA